MRRFDNPFPRGTRNTYCLLLICISALSSANDDESSQKATIESVGDVATESAKEGSHLLSLLCSGSEKLYDYSRVESGESIVPDIRKVQATKEFTINLNASTLVGFNSRWDATGVRELSTSVTVTEGEIRIVDRMVIDSGEFEGESVSYAYTISRIDGSIEGRAEHEGWTSGSDFQGKCIDKSKRAF